MDRLAGTAARSENSDKVLFQLRQPYGMAVDSKGQLYVADQKVGAIFIFNTETNEVELIKNKTPRPLRPHHRPGHGRQRPPLRFRRTAPRAGLQSKHNWNDVITDGLVDPGGLAIDTRKPPPLCRRMTNQDQVLVYDADTLKLLRKIGTAGQKHTLTTPGDFAKPTDVAVDKDGNIYVTDTLNDRVEIFDADGKFISTFGKNGDGPDTSPGPRALPSTPTATSGWPTGCRTASRSSIRRRNC